MIRFIDRYFSTSDQRGAITGLINCGEWRELNIIQSYIGTVRGNHYHKSTLEGFFLFQGKLEVSVQRIENNHLLGNKESHKICEGAVFLIEPMVLHEFMVIETSIWINFLSQRMDPASSDIYRFDSKNG